MGALTCGKQRGSRSHAKHSRCIHHRSSWLRSPDSLTPLTPRTLLNRTQMLGAQLGNTPLHFASANGHLQCVSALLEEDVEKDPPNKARACSTPAFDKQSINSPRINSRLSFASFLTHTARRARN